MSSKIASRPLVLLALYALFQSRFLASSPADFWFVSVSLGREQVFLRLRSFAFIHFYPRPFSSRVSSSRVIVVSSSAHRDALSKSFRIEFQPFLESLKAARGEVFVRSI